MTEEAKKAKGDPNCKTCFGAGEVMHGTMIPCPTCSAPKKASKGEE